MPISAANNSNDSNGENGNSKAPMGDPAFPNGAPPCDIDGI